MFTKNNVYNAVTMVVNDYDVDGLLALGCPNDEYEPEIDIIVDFILNNKKHIKKDHILLADNIQQVFMYMMGIVIPMTKAIAMAEKILELLVTFR